MLPLEGKRVLLVVGGGIAAYKALDLARALRRQGAEVRAILTKGGAEFITPLSLATLTGKPVSENLFSVEEEASIGHIRLAREADCFLVVPATADFLARAAQGRADDLATTTLLAYEGAEQSGQVLMAPAMNPSMWSHPATQGNLAALVARGVRIIPPAEGDMACGEVGQGRLAEQEVILQAVTKALTHDKLLAGRTALVTAGATRERLDDLRFISNGSSGKQGYAIAEALAQAGAEVRLVSAPTGLSAPYGTERIEVETAEEMEAACLAVSRRDLAVCAAAVSDWRPATREQGKPPRGNYGDSLALRETTDILARLGTTAEIRPSLLVGFAAETGTEQERFARAEAKRKAKNCDWILTNDISAASGVLGGDENQIALLSDSGVEVWQRAPKQAIAEALTHRIADYFSHRS